MTEKKTQTAKAAGAAPVTEQEALPQDFHARVLAVQAELRAPKDKYNSFGKYSYRSAEGILEAVKPLLKRYGLLLTLKDEVEEIGGRIYVRATARLWNVGSGEWMETCALAREDETKKGMDGSQITGTASSYARKYALNGLFLIDDTKDADTDEYAQQQGRRNWLAEIAKIQNIADLELWWNKNLDELKKAENYAEIRRACGEKGKELQR